MNAAEHQYLADDRTAENYGRWVTIRPRCSCGWQGDGYYLADKARALHSGHVWESWDESTRIADLEERERQVDAGRLCAICEERPNEQTLCGTKHCMRQGCVQECRFCLEELRDERD
ncbi:MAG TPA: hypothetical protein VFH56_08845 [Acidimicrobiales bacterium]|nr:hypothetical protein [Acidimicrobiales bacterium]